MKRLLSIFLIIGLTILSAKTLVTVNGHKITDALLAKGYEQLDPTKKANLVEQLIKEEVLYSDLLKSSIVNNEQFQQAFTQQKNSIEQQYGKSLNAEQLRSIKGAIALSLYQQQEFQNANVSKNEIKRFYQNNQDKFVFPNSVEIADIIVQDKATAKRILNTLRRSTNLDKDFIEVARKHNQNGYMGWFGRSSMPKNLFDRAYKYRPRSLFTSPEKTEHGYNVVYVLNKKTAGKLSYAQAEPKIEQMLKQKKVMEKLKNKVNNLYAFAEIIY